ETLTGTRLGQAEAELRAAQEAHPEITRRFRRKKYLHVHGNHDMVSGNVDGVPEEITLRADGVRLLFTHGHQGDDLVVKGQQASEFGVWLGGGVRRPRLHPIYRLPRSNAHPAGRRVPPPPPFTFHPARMNPPR